ncbi:Rpn family recombination-promoting nuclease/putative transposase [Cysteiniphilum halobium]|uniref:Rpn family recombination-promoting nuclease/putative transposase n=1 Tax=Cysteiniphilum halobium TaxID=2219059 RepID=UPI000E649153|nr:Rpn family recombination-promoting nuclease/putative transposase [Cysteiniphilum halobium]
MKSNNKIATPHDAFTKANLANADRAKELTKNHYSKEIVALIDFDSFQNRQTDFIQKDLRHIACDVLYSCKIKDSDGYIYFLYEPQSTPDKMMSFRLLEYSVQIMQMHLAQGNKKLPIILPCVIYHGEKSPYPFSNDLLDCFADVELAKQCAFKPFNLIDLTVTKDEDIAKLPPTLYFEYLLRHARDEDFAEKLIDFIEQHPQFVYYFLSGGVDFLNVVLSYVETRKNKDPESIGRLIKVIDNKTGGELMSILQRWQDEARLQGVLLGKAEGKAEGLQEKALATARNMLLRGYDAKEVAELNNLTMEEVTALADELNGSKH